MRSRNVWALLLWCSGCSVVLDAGRPQCKTDTDCGLIDGRPRYACVESYCEALSCTTDAECQERGSFVCGSDHVCAPAECIADADCTQTGESCTEGRCVDQAFQCFDQKQALTSSDPAVLELKLLAYGGTPVRNLNVRVCLAPDLPCENPLKVDTSYSDEGLLTIRKLTSGMRYAVRVSGADERGSMLLPVDYFMARPVVGTVREPVKIEMLPSALLTQFGASAGLVWTPTKGLVRAQIFGCDMQPLSGVSFSDSRMAQVFYVTGVPSTTATETDGSGVAGFANMEVDSAGRPLQHDLTLSYQSRPMFRFSVAPRPGVMTFLTLYLADYGTTVDRATGFRR